MAFLIPDSITEINGVNVKTFDLTKHNDNHIQLPSARTGVCAGVVIHNTERINAAKGTTQAEQYVRATYNGNMKDSRTTIYTDHIEAWQQLPFEYQNWTCGSKKNGVSEGENYGSEVGNKRCIAIECIMNGSGDADDVKAEDNAARLAAWLLVQNGLTIDNLYSHNYMVNVRRGKKGSVDYLNTAPDGYKGCPAFIRPHWTDFKAKVAAYMDKPSPNEEYIYRIQIGAFRNKAYAEAYLKDVQTEAKARPDAFIKAEKMK